MDQGTPARASVPDREPVGRARTVSAQRNGVDGQQGHAAAEAPESLRPLAERIGYLQAQLEQAERTIRLLDGASAPGAQPSPPAVAVPRRRGARGAFGAAGRHLQDALLTLVLALGLLFGFNLMAQSVQVEGASMEPTLRSGQYLLINRVAFTRVDGTPLAGLGVGVQQGSARYLLDGPRRGDIAVFRAPAEPGKHLVKRIIGLPGDSILIADGAVLVNATRLVEPYVRFTATYTYPPGGQALRVPSDGYFVLGDNRPTSADSHLGWFAPSASLVGRAWLSYWPPAAWGMLPSLPMAASVPESVEPSGSALPQSTLVPRSPPPAAPPESPAPAPVPTPPGSAPTSVPPLAVGRPTAAPAAARPAAADLPFEETFTDNRSGWPDEPGGPAGFRGGGYRMVAQNPGQFVAVSAPLAASVLRDIQVTGAFRKVGGPPGGGYGLIVRSQGPRLDGRAQTGQYYVFAAGDRGEVGVWRREVDRWADVLPWTPSDAVRPDRARNDLEVRSVGEQLTFLVNGTQVADVQDAGWAGGGVGIFVGGDLNEVLLERFSVRALEGPAGPVSTATSTPIPVPSSTSLLQPDPTPVPTPTFSRLQSAPTPEPTPNVAGAAGAPTPTPLLDAPEVVVQVVEPAEAPASWVFEPRLTRVAVGSTVTWTNLGTIRHTVTAESGAFDADLAPGESVRLRFSEPGSFAYLCDYHQWMKGTVEVVPAN